MTDQTPSAEDVLDAVTEYGKQRVDAVESFRCAEPDLEEVRAALAAHDREVAAKARVGGMREVADAYWSHDGEGDQLSSDYVFRKIHAHADRIEAAAAVKEGRG